MKRFVAAFLLILIAVGIPACIRRTYSLYPATTGQAKKEEQEKAKAMEQELEEEKEKAAEKDE